MYKKIIDLIFILLVCPAYLQAADLIENVKTSPQSMDISQGDVLHVYWEQAEKGQTTLHICDVEGNIVATLLRKEITAAGENEAVWDGMDNRHEPCAAGVYFPIIKVKSQHAGSETFNPTAIPWGSEVPVHKVDYNKTSQAIQYTLKDRALVRMRVGIAAGGPMYKNILNWQIKEPGTHNEIWDGMDVSQVVDVSDNDNLQIAVDAFSLPMQSVILSGSFLKKGKGNSPRYKHFPVHPPHGESVALYPRLPYGLLPDPEIDITFEKNVKNTKTGYELSSTSLVHVDLKKGLIGSAPKEDVELYTFMDGRLLFEGPVDGLPTSFSLNTMEFENGAHTLTVNIRTTGDRAASWSTPIFINNQ